MVATESVITSYIKKDNIIPLCYPAWSARSGKHAVCEYVLGTTSVYIINVHIYILPAQIMHEPHRVFMHVVYSKSAS